MRMQYLWQINYEGKVLLHFISGSPSCFQLGDFHRPNVVRVWQNA